MLEDENFLKWLVKAVDYKPYSLKNLFVKKTLKNQKTSLNHQEVYDFWLPNSIISNDSVNSSKRVTKMNFLKNYKNIVDPEVREEEKTCKRICNVTMIVATKRI